MKFIKPSSPAKPKFGAVTGDNALATIKDVNQVIAEINAFSADQSINATGVTQATAAGLIVGINIVTTAVGDDGVILPCLSTCEPCLPCTCCLPDQPEDPAAPVIIKNLGTEPLNIYPCLGVSIDGMAPNAPFILPAGSSIEMRKIDCSNWASFPGMVGSIGPVCTVTPLPTYTPVLPELSALTGTGALLNCLDVCIDGTTITKNANGCLQALGVDGVQTLTGCNVDNTDPQNPIINDTVVDGTTITGTGCVGDPLVAVNQGVCTDATLTGDGTVGNCLSVVGSAASLGYAEYVQHTQGSNASVAPGSAIEYLTDNPAGVFNTLGITTTTGPGGQGTEFLLPIGVYMIDFENSADAAWSLAIYKSLVTQTEVIDTNTIAGASTATTWIHGRAIISAAAPTYIIISPVTGTQAIPTAGTAAGEFIARLTILKIA